MGVAVDIRRIARVLLGDGWHDVVPGTFVVDEYEFTEAGRTLMGPGLNESSGAAWDEGLNVRMTCPLTSILAVATVRRV